MDSHDSPRSILLDRALWTGILGILVGLVVSVLLFNYAVMPIWTRHDASVSVPDVRQMAPGEAERALVLAGFDAEMGEQPFNPNVAADLVVDQSPSADARVKPGRRVIYYVNASPKELVAMPDVTTLSEGAARPQIEDVGLDVWRVEFDSVRTPYENTVTRQLPAPGRRIPRGTRVQLWLSRGVDKSRQVTVPDVLGMTPSAARLAIRQAGLYADSPRATGIEVTSQDPERGTKANPGQEVVIQSAGRARQTSAPDTTDDE